MPLPDVLVADYLAEVRNRASLPAEGSPEIAIAGRSNVGKSTLLNRLAGRRSLARTSKTPGRTRGLVLYDLAVAPLGTDHRHPTHLRLVDLPGYGYARVSQAERQSWQSLVESYVTGRRTLRLFVVLVDARRGIEEEERQLFDWLDGEAIPTQLVYTKVDKLTASERGLLRNLRSPPRSAAAQQGDAAQTGAGGIESATAGSEGPSPAANPRNGTMRRPLFVSGETGEGTGELWRVILGTLPSPEAPSNTVAASEQTGVT